MDEIEEVDDAMSVVDDAAAAVSIFSPNSSGFSIFRAWSGWHANTTCHEMYVCDPLRGLMQKAIRPSTS